MYGYVFETTNKKTGETYIGKRYAVSFDKKFFGEEDNNELAKAIEKYGRVSFESKMLMPFESKLAVDDYYDELRKKAEVKVIEKGPKQTKVKEPEFEVEQNFSEEIPIPEPVEEKKPAKRGRKKKTEEE